MPKIAAVQPDGIHRFFGSIFFVIALLLFGFALWLNYTQPVPSKADMMAIEISRIVALGAFFIGLILNVEQFQESLADWWGKETFLAKVCIINTATALTLMGPGFVLWPAALVAGVAALFAGPHLFLYLIVRCRR